MTDNVSVSISADIADLQDQFAEARTTVSDLADELNRLGEQAQTAGEMLDRDATEGASKAFATVAASAREYLEVLAQLTHVDRPSEDPADEMLDARIAVLKSEEKKIQNTLPQSLDGYQVPTKVPIPEVQAPVIDIADPQKAQGQANRAADIARHLTEEIAQSDEQLALKQIAAAQQANNFELQMGEESLEQWKRNAREEADAKLSAELAFLDKKLVADQGNALAFQKDLDQIRAAYQEHDNRLAALDQQYQEKKRQQDQTALQDRIQSDNTEYQDTVSRLNSEITQHQISAQQRREAEVALATSVKQAELAMFDATHQGLVKGTTAWNEAVKQRQAIVDTFNRRVKTADDQLTSEEQQKWTQLGNSIRSSFNSAIDSMLFQGKTFGQAMLTVAQGVVKAFLEMGEKIAEDWIEKQIESIFVTKSAQATSALGQITDNAAVAASGAAAATAAIPIVGPELAPAAAASTFADTMSWASALGLAVGAWEIPQDMRAIIHKGEMVVPRTFAEGLRGARGFGGGDVSMHYAPTINAREPATLSQMLTRESGEMLAWLNRQFRNGALRSA